MKIHAKKEYEPAPEYQGRAVCVDVTDPQEMESQWGPREVLRIKFELPLKTSEGENYVVRTGPMTPSLHEKATFRKFIRGMLGRELTNEELKEFDTENLIGKNVNISIVHETSDDGRTFDQIALCRPWKGDPVEATGNYVREKDRKDKKASAGKKPSVAHDDDSDPESGNESSFRRTEGQQAPTPTDYGSIKVHVGKNNNVELRDLSREAITTLIEKWLRKDYLKIEKPSAQDKRLVAALESYEKKFKGDEPEEEDDVPY